MNDICLASGSLFHKTHFQEGELVEFAKNLDVDGIELTLIERDDALRFSVSDEAKKWLKGLSSVSIHGPLKHMYMADYLNKVPVSDDLLAPVYDRVESIYNEFNCKRVVIHPMDIPSMDFLSSYNFKVSTENMSKKHKPLENSSFEYFLKKYDNIGLCLDVSHAFTLGVGETKRIVDNFEDRITSVHFSGTTVLGVNGEKTHIKVRNCGNEFFESIEPIFSLNVPVVIEEDFEKGFSIEEVQEEIGYIRELWSNKKK